MRQSRLNYGKATNFGAEDKRELFDITHHTSNNFTKKRTAKRVLKS